LESGGEGHRCVGIAGVGNTGLELGGVLQGVLPGLDDDVADVFGFVHTADVIELVDLVLETGGGDVLHPQGDSVTAVVAGRAHDHHRVGVGVGQVFGKPGVGVGLGDTGEFGHLAHDFSAGVSLVLHHDGNGLHVGEGAGAAVGHRHLHGVAVVAVIVGVGGDFVVRGALEDQDAVRGANGELG